MRLHPPGLLRAKGLRAGFGSVVLLAGWTCLKTEICLKRAVTSPAASFRYRCIDVSPIPLTNAVGKLFLKSEKIFYQKFSWGGKNPFNKTEDGLDPEARRNEHKPRQPSAPLERDAHRSKAALPWVPEQKSSGEAARGVGDGSRGFPCSTPNLGLSGPKVSPHGSVASLAWDQPDPQSGSHPLSQCWAVAEFSFSPRLPSFPFWLSPSSFCGLSISATSAAPSPPEALILRR